MSARLHRLAWLICIPLLLGMTNANACTTVVVSGKATVDGRPLLWKNRDTWQRQNELVYESSGRYAFVGVANAGATQRIRMGVNTAGLCLENSVSRDLAPSVESGLTNGELIRRALMTCATADEFIQLLEETNGPGRKTRGNFGIIDHGGAALMIEVGPHSYRVFDANDPEDAPHGYIVRANFSKTAAGRKATDEADSVYSIERYNRADELCRKRVLQGPIDLPFLLREVARDIGPCSTNAFATEQGDVPASLNTQKTLNRNNTVSAVVFQGVLPTEPPKLATMWTMLGQPMFSVAIPSWASQGGIAEATHSDRGSELCQLAIELTQKLYSPDGRKLLTGQLAAVSSQVAKAETEALAKWKTQFEAWMQRTPTDAQLRQAHETHVASALTALRRINESLPKGKTTTRGPVKAYGIDFAFEGANGTRLGDAANDAADTGWTGGFTDSSIVDGSFRIRRNKTSALNRYVTLKPSVRVRGESFTRNGYLVVEVAGWNLRGKTLGEEVRFGFTSQGENDYQTAGMRLKRTDEDTVTLSGLAFGDGSSAIESVAKFPAEQTRPITFVLQLDKAASNPDEGDTGGEYHVFYREQGQSQWNTIGHGLVRRSRNGNEVHLRAAGLFAAKNEHFDIDRIYFTKTSPILP